MKEALLPRPRTIVPGPRRALTRQANIVVGPCSARLEHAAGRLPPLGLAIGFAVEEPSKTTPALADRCDYRLTFGDRVQVQAATEWGALAALATMAQLGAGDSLAVAEVRDEPRFPWRGLMIDTVRHFISLVTLERTLDAMWFYKLNVLHLHLTDDQGFRFRSRAYPELASADAYSANDLRRLVAYAADRGIRIVPELDMPGHVTSWLAARPEWRFGDGAAPAPSRRFGVHQACLDPANPEVLAAVGTLLEELAGIFPDQFVHFGGDEASLLPPGRQAAFHRAVIDQLAQLGKRAIGWDECLHDDTPRGTAIQAWRGSAARDTALAAGFDCVLSAPYYLDLFYPADIHYAFDPTGDLAAAEAALLADARLRHVRTGIEWMRGFATFPELPARPPGRVLGGEACLWTELVTDDLLDARLWSRMPAIAERLWSEGELPGGELYRRMAASRRQLADLGTVAEDRAALDAYPELAPLIEMLEPVKWYRRLLGGETMARRVSGLGAGSEELRPYDADTPLDRIVDLIPPGSLASRRAAADLAAGASMDRWLAGWRRQRSALNNHPQLLAELRDVSNALVAIADGVAGKPCADAEALAGPFGEYLLPIAHALPTRR